MITISSITISFCYGEAEGKIIFMIIVILVVASSSSRLRGHDLSEALCGGLCSHVLVALDGGDSRLQP